MIQSLNTPNENTAISCSLIKFLSKLIFIEIFLPMPLASPIIVVFAPGCLNDSAISHAEWGKCWEDNVGEITAISIPVNGDFISFPNNFDDKDSITLKSSLGINISIVISDAVTILFTRYPPISSNNSNNRPCL